MDWSGFGNDLTQGPGYRASQGVGTFGALGRIAPGENFPGGLLDVMRRLKPAAAPAVPADGAMQPTIGPGMATPAPAAVAPQFKAGLPPGGILGLLRGQSPQGLLGMLKGMGGSPLAGAMPQAGMLPGSPGNPIGPPAPAPVTLPTDINPMNQF